MRITLTFLSICLALFAKSQSQIIINEMAFIGLENTIKKGYGSKEDPIPSGAFINIADAQNRSDKMRRLFNSYRWPDGQSIDFSKRFSTANASGKGIVDCYTIIKPGTTDTLSIFVDPYQKAEKYFVPEGLSAITPQLLKKELEPILKQIDEINNADDGAALKIHAANILAYLGGKLNYTFLIDEGNLKAIASDKIAEEALKDYLFKSYVFNKFYAYAKEIANEQSYAFDKMKLQFQKYLLAHPNANTGALKDILK
ncbi:hypothetical protein [Pedobacter sp. ASV28]|uniref:hypothetical protein n=1 Tax=Pedobacter sp. ASV28 TaxID=2795123 RepID=UPI0018EC0CE9|nr:hypothetical protein [Pedobacter sp. ASV28]